MYNSTKYIKGESAMRRTVKLKLNTLKTLTESSQLELMLNKFKSVKAYVNIASKLITVKFNDKYVKLETLIDILESMGYYSMNYSHNDYSNYTVSYLYVNPLDALTRDNVLHLLKQTQGINDVLVKTTVSSVKIVHNSNQVSIKDIKRILRKNGYYVKIIGPTDIKPSRYKVVDALAKSDISGRTLLFYATAAMQNVNSEIAQALADFSEKQQIQTPYIDDIEYADKDGAVVEVNQQIITAGSKKFFQKERIKTKNLPQSDKGKTHVLVKVDDEIIGSVFLAKAK